MAKLYGESIPEGVVKQLVEREKVLASGARDSQQLRFLQEKTAWVRAISGVDIKDDSNFEYSSNIAQQFILSGGRLIWNSKANPPKFETRADNVNFGNLQDGRYSFTEDLGIRPEPGITGFSIAHKNRWGTIREANLNFVVWTREDLERAERLYLRPGAQIVLEWGNSLYLSNPKDGSQGGTVEDIPGVEKYNEFFTQTSVERIYEIINETKKNSDYNYDGFLGFVINFSWSYRLDGGYDCSIKIISRSAVLESLTLLKPSLSQVTSGHFEEIEKRSLLDFFISVCNKNKIPQVVDGKGNLLFGSKNHLTLDDLKTITISPEAQTDEFTPASTIGGFTGLSPQLSPAAQGTRPQANIQTNILALLNTNLSDYVYLKTDPIFNSIKIYGADEVVETETRDSIKLRYISLRHLLALINTSFIFSNSKYVDLPSFYVGQKIKEELVEDTAVTEEVQTYKTFDQHVSLDPFFAILPKRPTFTQEEKELFFYKKNEDENTYFKYNPQNISYLNPFEVRLNLITDSIINDESTNENDILDIHLNLNAVQGILNSFLAKNENPERINVYDLVSNILKELNTVLGGINAFDIAFDEDLQKFFIVDREVVNEKFNALGKDSTNDKNNGVQTLNISGLKNTVMDVSLESKISSELASMIAISNQATIPADINSSQPFIDWNEGTRNRFFNSEQVGPESKQGTDLGGNQRLNLFSNITFETPPPEGPYNEDLLSDRAFANQAQNAVINEKRAELEKIAETNKIERQKFFKDLSIAYKRFNGLKKGIFNRPNYKKVFFDKAKADGYTVYKKRLTTYNKNEKSSDQGVIPIEFSLTLDGISGLKIGQIFKIGSLSENSTVLPGIYDGYGFLINGINSTIDADGKWRTTIQAQTFRLD